jgi:DNA-directed RNA polymerase specialized sigma24 family protein
MTKERLRRYREIKGEARQIREKLEEVESRLYSPKGQLLTGMPSAPAPGGGTITEVLIDRHAQLVQMYQEQLSRLNEEQLAVEAAIESLEDSTARQLLRYRYIDGLKWEEVCVRIKYGWAQTHDIHSKALQQLRAQEKPEA